MQRHGGLAGARPALDDQDAGQVGADHPVLLGLDGGDDVAHPAGPALPQGGQQGGVTVEGGLLGLRQGVEVEHLVVEADDLPAVGQQVPAADDALGVGGRGPVEGLGGRGPPVDQQRLVVGFRQAEAADVVPGAVVHVEAPEAQRQVADVEGGEPVLQVDGQGVAFLAPLVGAAGLAPDPAELGVELAPGPRRGGS